MPTYTRETFVLVAPDCPALAGTEPPSRKTASIAELQFRLLTEDPYSMTFEDLTVEVARLRRGLPPSARAELLAEIFAKPQACMRTSPLTRRYGWGVHVDGEGHLALFGRGSAEYERQAARGDEVHVTPALRSKRA